MGPFPFAQPAFDNVKGDLVTSNNPGNLTYGELGEYSLYEGERRAGFVRAHRSELAVWLRAHGDYGGDGHAEPRARRGDDPEGPNGSHRDVPGKDPITVTPDIPLNPDGTPAFASSLDYPPVIWPAILEKSYADLKGNDYSNLGNTHSGVSMDTFAGGTGTDIIPDITNTTVDELADKFESGEAITSSAPFVSWNVGNDKWGLVDDGDKNPGVRARLLHDRGGPR